MRSISVFLCFALLLIATSLSAQAEKRVALVIGINDYPKLKTPDHPDLMQLDKAVADAETMAATLTALGFDVELVRNADRTTFLTALDRAKRKIAPGDIVFFFFSGHGVALKGSNLLLPADFPPVPADSENVIRGLAVAETDVIQAAREKSAGLIVLALDACRNNPIEDFAREQARIQGRAFRSLGTMRTVGLEARPTSGVFSIYSAGIGQRALDGLGNKDPDRNSVFTRVFAKELQKPGHHLADVMEEVKEKVATLAATVKDPESNAPHKQFPAYYNETRGGRIFLAGRPKADAKASAGGTGNKPAPDPARDAWNAAKDTDSVKVLEAFIAKFGDSFYATLAKARLEALKKEQAETEVAVGVFAEPEAEPANKPGDTLKDCEDCPEMVVVPAGSFTMGSPPGEKGRVDFEDPQHSVTIAKAFAVGKFEVTKDQFDAFVRESNHDAQDRCWIAEDGLESDETPGRSWRDPGFSQSGDHPVVCVSWDDAKAYAEWLSSKTGKTYRLLSEAEWEYAARAGTTTRFSFGNRDTDLCRYGNGADQTAKKRVAGMDTSGLVPCTDGHGYTAPAGSFAANAFGLHDVHGNVFEWVQDCWHDDYSGAPSDGSAWTAGDCDRRVVRGGTWFTGPSFLRSADRRGGWADSRDFQTGFRVARML